MKMGKEIITLAIWYYGNLEWNQPFTISSFTYMNTNKTKIFAIIKYKSHEKLTIKKWSIIIIDYKSVYIRF